MAKYTYEQIKKALECMLGFLNNDAVDALDCCGCAFYVEGELCYENCSDGIAKATLDLINRQEAEKEALIAGQETLQKYLAEKDMNEWRPASEPPTEAGEYNVIIDGFAITTTLYYSRAHSGWYEFNDDEYSIPYAVTHWMPLPQPPKEVE